MSSGTESVDALVVGAGPAGLAAAIELRRLGVPRVLVVEREEEAGGIPRHTDHTGFGMRDLHRVLSGPQYARRYVELAQNCGVALHTSTTVTGWLNEGTVGLTGPSGITTVDARAVVLATGCRERPRPARLIPGDRPLGVLTTGSLQQLVHRSREPIGRRALVVGAEHVSFSAVLTLAHAGLTTVAMVTEHPRHQTFLPYKWLSATRWRVPLLTSRRVTRIVGNRRVRAAIVTHIDSGLSEEIPCDTVVLTGDWIPDHELARRGELRMDPASRSPRVDGALHTSRPGVFAAGNLVHPVETADVAALSGRHAARSVYRSLAGGRWPERSIDIVCSAPVQWVSPSVITSDGATPAQRRFTWRVSTCVDGATLVIRQGERELWRKYYRRLTPSLPVHAPVQWLDDVALTGDVVTFSLV